MILVPVPTLSNNWKSHVASHSAQLELINAVVLLMMPSVLCDTYTGITWPKGHVEPHFNHLHLKNDVIDSTISVMWCSHWHQQHYITKRVMLHLISILFTLWKMVPLIMQLASHHSSAGTNGNTWLKKSCFTSFWTLWTNKCSGAIDNTINITDTSRHCLDMSIHWKNFCTLSRHPYDCTRTWSRKKQNNIYI